MTIFLILALILFVLLIVESVNIAYNTKRIPLRILVNGTRGKSSVTAYITAVLQAADKKTIAKITGIIPTIIYHDGSQKIIKRKFPARVTEQFKLIRLASRLSADCLVIECMSVSPELQKLESKVFKPHIYVITNIKDDHREQLGSESEQVKVFCDAIPYNAVLVTNEKKYLREIESAAKQKKSNLVVCDDSINLKGLNVTRDTIESNVNIAFTVCKGLGVSEKIFTTAINAKIHASDKLLYELNIDNKKIKFLNGFAVNDISSASDFLNQWKAELTGSKKLNIILNTRTDRPLRSIAFVKWLGTLKNIGYIIVTGNHSPRTKFELIKNKVDAEKIFVWKKDKAEKTYEHLKDFSETDSIFVGLGNIAGEGRLIIKSLKDNSIVIT